MDVRTALLNVHRERACNINARKIVSTYKTFKQVIQNSVVIGVHCKFTQVREMQINIEVM